MFAQICKFHTCNDEFSSFIHTKIKLLWIGNFRKKYLNFGVYSRHYSLMWDVLLYKCCIDWLINKAVSGNGQVKYS